MECEGEEEGEGEGGMYQDGGEENQFEPGSGMDVDGPSSLTDRGKHKAMDNNFSDPTPSPEPFQVPDKGATSAYNSRQAGFQFAVAKAQTINSRAASRPPSSCAVSHTTSRAAPHTTPCAASRAASSPGHTTSCLPLSRAVSRPPSDGQLFSPISSMVSAMSSEKGKRICLNLQDQMSQVESATVNDGPGAQRLAIVMERNHRLATKLNHLKTKEVDILLEEAKARSAEQRVKEHLAMAEMLHLQLKLKGVNSGEDG
ncbi:hypothetical protein PAXRUDRAFT_21098 [Paxillus rubicundulus Ve08.2h10]|uniref:Uncharacterized protein n=1 Tax=Paxillus rubicundulus Ve08.2h10 TaxID=930991 RepID=A0A0D0BNU0_9AGAM|nr:hypothetical protein PAXRUDRAFT_21098 [Paxillus rubicundulus Ve08.2h10]